MSKTKSVVLLSARERMFFKVTPVYPISTKRHDKPSAKKAALPR